MFLPSPMVGVANMYLDPCRVEASTTDHSRDYASNLEKYKAVQMFLV